MNVSIRAATTNDVQAMLALEQAAPSAAHWSVAQYEHRIADGCVLVAESGSRICGFLCARTAAGEWEVENVVVEDRSRRLGVGSNLMGVMMKNWRECSGSAVLLEVRESNAAARALYAKSGLVQVGRRQGYYRDPVEDALLYSREDFT